MKLKHLLASGLGCGALILVAACTKTEEKVVVKESRQTEEIRSRYNSQLTITNELTDMYNSMLKANQNTHEALWATQLNIASVDEGMKNILRGAEAVQSSIEANVCDNSTEEKIAELDQSVKDTIKRISDLEQLVSVENLAVIEANIPLNYKADAREQVLARFRQQTQEFLRRFNGFREMAVSIPFHVKSDVRRACGNLDQSSFAVDDYRPEVGATPYASGGVSGKVLAQNGSDPVVDALIYVPVSGNENLENLEEIKQQAQANQTVLPCGEPQEPYIVKTCSNAKGEYQLANVPTGNINITIKKGLFVLRSVVVVQMNVVVSMELEQSTLPKEDSETADVARITVVSGSYDHLEKVLDKIGLGDSNDRNYQLITSQQLMTILNSPEELSKIDLLMINCGNGHENVFVDSTQAKNNLKSWVEAGGRLFVTDQSYDFVEQLFPQAIQFRGDTSDNESGPVNAAQKGAGGEIFEASIDSPSLFGWLRSGVRCGAGNGTQSNCILSNDKVQIQGFAGGWVQMVGLSSANAKAWVSNSERPLTVTFNAGKGKVFYSSYHTDHGAERTTIVPQERILQYFVFEVID